MTKYTLVMIYLAIMVLANLSNASLAKFTHHHGDVTHTHDGRNVEHAHHAHDLTD